MNSVDFDEEARAEFLAAVDYYNSQRKGLGDEFAEEVQTCLDQIVRSPRVFTPFGRKGLRRCNVDRFPYSIFFQEVGIASGLPPSPINGVNPVIGHTVAPLSEVWGCAIWTCRGRWPRCCERRLDKRYRNRNNFARVIYPGRLRTKSER